MEPTPDITHRPLLSGLIVLPVGLWGIAIAAEALFRVGWGDAIWHDVSFYAMGAGIVGAILAPLPDLVQQRFTKPRDETKSPPRRQVE